MADHQSNNSDQQLNANSVSKFDVTIMGISGAAPVMCIAASMGDIMSLSGTAAALAFILATIVLVMVGSSFGRLSERFNSAGGAYAYVRDTFGSKLGFVTAYLFFGNMICTGIIGGVFSRMARCRIFNESFGRDLVRTDGTDHLSCDPGVDDSGGRG